MKILFNLILLALIGLGVVWYFGEARQDEKVQVAERELIQGAVRMKEAIQDKIKEFALDNDDIKDELARSGKVVRKIVRQVSAVVAEATADARISGAIKLKLVSDPDLAAWSISVSTTNGVVTLSGTVSSYDAIGKAMLIALETDGVHEVISTLQIKPGK